MQNYKIFAITLLKIRIVLEQYLIFLDSEKICVFFK